MTKSPATPGRRAWGLIAVLVVVSVLVGAALGVALVRARTPDEVAPATAVELVPVTVEPFDDSRDVELTVTVPQPVAVPAPADGIVTSWSCVPGQLASSGTQVATIGNLPVVGLHTESPMWRDVKVGSSGSDVSQISTELHRLGLLDSPVETANAKLIAALAQLAGLPKDTTTIPVGTFFWLSQPSVAWSACDVAVGSRVSLGQQLGSLVSQPTALTLKAAPSSPVAGERILTIDEASAPITDLSLTDPTALTAMALTPTYQLWQSTAGVVPLRGTWRLASPVDGATVPAAAITAGMGIDCVHDETASYPVTVVSSSLGYAQVTFVEAVPEQVFAVAPSGASCP